MQTDMPSIQSTVYSCNANQLIGSVIPATDRTWTTKNIFTEPVSVEDWIATMDKTNTKEEPEIVSNRRIVNLYIVDTDKKLNLVDAILYKEEGIATDYKDIDLLYGIDIKGLLKKHNAKRIVTLDEELSNSRDKDVFLKEIRPSELSMKVVTIVQF